MYKFGKDLDLDDRTLHPQFFNENQLVVGCASCKYHSIRARWKDPQYMAIRPELTPNHISLMLYAIKSKDMVSHLD